jgi:two-component system phosphate regulon sensor histidine kinase PhoR
VSSAARRLGGSGGRERVAGTSGATAELTASFNAMAGHVEGILAKVRAEQARLQAMINSSSSGVVALSSDTSVQLLNAAAAQLLGASPGMAIGRPLIESARDYELDGIVRAAVAGESATRVITFGAGRLPLQVSARPIAGGGGWAVLLLLVDLTEATRVDQVRRDFLSNVSHELRTPLASIRALAETLESGDVDPGEETHEFVHRIVQQADRMTTLVNEFLDLSRIESGAIELHPEAIAVDELVAESIALLRQRADAASVTLTSVGGAGLRFEADRAAVLRVVNNLLDNAIKFSPAGSTVTVEAADAGDLVAISVRDQGPGIPPSDLPRVFERFYKGDQSRADGGVGLGLAIVKHTVRLHGGTAEARSEPGQGATFTVRLPKHFVPLRVSPRR